MVIFLIQEFIMSNIKACMSSNDSDTPLSEDIQYE